jgi:hypothetical protein
MPLEQWKFFVLRCSCNNDAYDGDFQLRFHCLHRHCHLRLKGEGVSSTYELEPSGELQNFWHEALLHSDIFAPK